jgi:hypothetical protein
MLKLPLCLLCAGSTVGMTAHASFSIRARAPSFRAAQLCMDGIAFDGLELLATHQILEQVADTKLAAVYEVTDPAGSVAYVGISRNVVLSLNAHLVSIPEMADSTIRLRSFPEMDRLAMEALKKEWIEAVGYLPAGNGGPDAERWAASLQQVKRPRVINSSGWT